MASNSAVELKGSMYTFLSLKLHSNNPASVAEALADKVQQAPGFFANTPVVVDLTPIEDESGTDAAGLLEVIRQQKLVPVVVSISDKESAIAGSIDIPLVEAGNKKGSQHKSRQQDSTQSDRPDEQQDEQQDEKQGDLQKYEITQGQDKNLSGTGTPDRNTNSAAPAETDATDKPAESPAKSASETPASLAIAASEVEYVVKSPKLVAKPVRSGQQVYALDTDLVVIGAVGPGAEIIATNNVHVYGPLRGRALCGVAGNTEARIFCQSLEAELVSVAGNYKVLEEIPEELRGKPAQIWFQNDKLMMEPL